MTAMDEWGEVTHLYNLARSAANEFVTKHEGTASYGSIDDVVQEGVTWLLERPGRAWVRAVDGTMEDPEETTVKDIVEHLQRVQWGG